MIGYLCSDFISGGEELRRFPKLVGGGGGVLVFFGKIGTLV